MYMEQIRIECNGPNNMCAQCGNCCRIISTGLNMDGLKNILNNCDLNEDQIYSVNYILANWIEIINPIDIWRIFPDKSIDYIYNNYYICKNFNRFSNKCMDYKNRPWICREYPFYGRDNPVNSIYEKCVFNK